MKHENAAKLNNAPEWSFSFVQAGGGTADMGLSLPFCNIDSLGRICDRPGRSRRAVSGDANLDMTFEAGKGAGILDSSVDKLEELKAAE